MLCRARYLDINSNVHPIANPVPYKQFYNYLSAFAYSKRILLEDYKDLT